MNTDTNTLTSGEKRTSRRLNVGAGDVEIPGYIPVDRRFGSEAYPLDFPDEFADEILASHVLEHFARVEIRPVLIEWRRVLKPGGVLEVATPDFHKVVELAKVSDEWQAVLFGGQMDENDFHKVAFTPGILENELRIAGFEDIRPWKGEYGCAALPISLNLQGVKP